jgi:hypothetical protein
MEAVPQINMLLPWVLTRLRFSLALSVPGSIHFHLFHCVLASLQVLREESSRSLVVVTCIVERDL